MLNIERSDFCKINPYQDQPQTLGKASFISAPHLHAYCLEILKDKLKNSNKILDIGAGSGYLTLAFALGMEINQQNQQQLKIKQQQFNYKQQQKLNQINKLRQTDQTRQKVKDFFKHQNQIGLKPKVSDYEILMISKVLKKEEEKKQKIQENLKIISQQNLNCIPDDNFQEREHSSIFSTNLKVDEKQNLSQLNQQNEQEQEVRNDTSNIFDASNISISEKKQLTEQMKSNQYVCVGIEHIQEIAQQAYSNIQKKYKYLLDKGNINICYGDGKKGFKLHAPYDIINVAACVEKVPEELVEQLKIGGQLLIMIGDERNAVLTIYTKDKHGNLHGQKQMSVERQNLLQTVLEQLDDNYKDINLKIGRSYQQNMQQVIS
ncbi:hypothetical protein PPERSA_05914 [Pseudocohnilembus persalinus]|uniref:protein-L-isoaspartate(D-aspartate) O-methyltransferase n=1 Tax=Pseudocohnilembus persalinus TaxID=266149 RepID=A0A0V0R434_PSEPJ|nr:hypothetical protein PPERSA_05914 [Pseudocohnilembus persalinus]|eukprot:KRX09245.1 hypothetical protein PPERSA_05914 [Pseudocohnilembus persalinus]